MDGAVYQRMAARKTASFGQAYNYSQMAYPYQEFLPELEAINVQLETLFGFFSNQFYQDLKSSSILNL